MFFLSFFIFLLNGCQEDLVIQDNDILAETESIALKNGVEPSYLLYLIETIEDLVLEGTLSEGQGNSLIVKINNAIKSYEKGNETPFVNQLNALINELEDYIINEILDFETGQSLIELTEDITEGIYEPQYGDILITEVMMNPSVLSDSDGEWFELYNNTDHNIDLNNLTVKDDDLDSFTIDEILIIAPGSYFVFEINEVATDVEGYVYGKEDFFETFHLGNSGDEVVLVYNGEELARMSYYMSHSGKSLFLKQEFFNVEDAKLTSSWGISTSLYSTGNYGTPGAPNDL